MARRAARKDANQRAIEEIFAGFGFSVFDTSRLGLGFPDMVVGKFGQNWLIEVKDGSKPPSQRKLTEDEVFFHDNWQGQVCIISTEDEAIAFCRSIIKEGKA